MTRWLPRSLSAQIIALTLLSLLISQVVGYASLVYQQKHMVERIVTDYMSQSVPSVDRMLAHIRPGEAREAVQALSNRFAVYDLKNHPLRCPAGNENEHDYARNLAAELNIAAARTRVCVGPGLRTDRPGKTAVALSVRRADDSWLEIRSRIPGRHGHWLWNSLRNILITAVIMILAVILASRRITRPLRDLASAAERFGRGERVAPVAERGGEEIKRSIVEFNRMRERLERFVAERTRLVAALAHDLRTPITAMRLRLEFLAEDDNTRAMDTILEDMAHMSEAALTFMREESSTEATRKVDLAALIDALCEDYRAANAPVAFEPTARVTIICRPVGIRRTLRNVIDNALTYGESAAISLASSTDVVVIDVEDNGPGIDSCRMESVFDAFVRIETSRSRETGGVGLGLSIARSVVRGHGGEITLANRPAGGLCVRIRLPRPSS